MRERIEILLEDNHLIAINKMAGDLVQGDDTGDWTLADKCKTYIKDKYHKPGEVFLGVVHRLDRPVSGVVLFARTSKALSRMNELFRSRETEKMYWVVSDRKPVQPGGELVHWLEKNEGKNRVTVYKRETPGAQRCELSYKVLDSQGALTLFEVYPITGRSHQIRAQLAAVNCPLIGDVKYGSAYVTGDKSIGLHARLLAFQHPVKKEPVRIVAAPPDRDWWRIFK